MEKDIQIADKGENTGWKTKTLLFGGFLGAVTGLGAAYLLVRRAEQEGEQLSISSGQGLKLGVMLAGVLRSVLNLDEE